MSTNSALKKCGLILEPVIKTVPGFVKAQFVYAKVKFISGTVLYFFSFILTLFCGVLLPNLNSTLFPLSKLKNKPKKLVYSHLATG